MSSLRNPFAELLQGLQVQVESLAFIFAGCFPRWRSQCKILNAKCKLQNTNESLGSLLFGLIVFCGYDRLGDHCTKLLAFVQNLRQPMFR